MKSHSVSRALRSKRANLRQAFRFSAFESFEPRILLSAPPAVINNAKILFFATSATANDVVPDVQYVATLANGTTVHIQDMTDPTLTTSSNFSYTVTDASHAAFGFLSSNGGTHGITMAFGGGAVTTGTYLDTNPDGTASGTFVLLTNPIPSRAPTTIAGGQLSFKITSAGGSFAPTGSFNIITASTGPNYVLQTISGKTPSVSGTASYIRNDPSDAQFSYLDQNNINGNIFLAFTAGNSGIFYNTDAIGTDSFFDFQSGTFTFSPGPIVTNTTTTLKSSINPSVTGTSVTLTATVTPSSLSPNVATGVVTFKDGTATIGTGTANSAGVATIAISLSADGSPHALTAVYAGDTNFKPSTSAVLSQIVTHTHADNVTYVTQIFTDILHRPVDSGALDSFVGQLDAGTATFASVATVLVTSTEYQGDVVDGLYVQFLHRHVDSTSRDYWVGKMQAGMTADAVTASLVSSDEYFNNAGGTNSGYITALYQGFFGRAPSSDDLAYWTGKLATQSRMQVATSFVTSDEYRTTIINSLYLNYLDRPAASSDLSYWKSKMAAGVTEAQITVSLVTSTEYLTDHGIG